MLNAINTVDSNFSRDWQSGTPNFEASLEFRFRLMESPDTESMNSLTQGRSLKLEFGDYSVGYDSGDKFPLTTCNGVS